MKKKTKEAQQLIREGKIMVENEVITSHGWQVRPFFFLIFFHLNFKLMISLFFSKNNRSLLNLNKFYLRILLYHHQFLNNYIFFINLLDIFQNQIFEPNFQKKMILKTIMNSMSLIYYLKNLEQHPIHFQCLEDLIKIPQDCYYLEMIQV